MATVWDDEEFKEAVKAAYLSNEPTAKTSPEILKELGIEFEVSPNSIRTFLTKEGVYVSAKREPAEVDKDAKATGTKRIPKEVSLKKLKELIISKDKEVDDTIVDKMTGKAAEYFINILS